MNTDPRASRGVRLWAMNSTDSLRLRWLERHGILLRWRASMSLRLAELHEAPSVPAGFEVVSWDHDRLAEVAEVDFRAYRGTIDGHLYSSYFSTVEGCGRMWREAIDGRFGTFDPQHTLLLSRDDSICGDVMVSRVGTADAFIGNLAIHPTHRGGTGRSLLLTCLERCRADGLQRVSLAVTFENQRAMRLYKSLGFCVYNRFPRLTFVRPPGRTESAWQ